MPARSIGLQGREVPRERRGQRTRPPALTCGPPILEEDLEGAAVRTARRAALAVGQYRRPRQRPTDP